MKYAIRIAYALISLATIPAANAASLGAAHVPAQSTQMDWSNG